MTDKKQKTPIRIVEMAALETAYPIVNDNTKRKWVTYGLSNEYPEYLLDLFLESPTNNAIITAFTQMVAGDGLEVTDAATNPTANILVQSLFSPEKIKKIAFNLKLYGYAPVILKGNKRVVASHVSDGNKWRSGVKNPETGEVESWWYSEDWENTNTKQGRPVEYPLFDYDSVADEQVYVFLLPNVGLEYYPPVDYNGGTTYIQLEAEIGEFHLSAIQNGLYPATMLNFNNGIPPEEEQDEIEKKVGRKFGGSSNAGKFFLSFNDSSESAATVDVIPQPDIDKQYEFLSKETTTKVMLAHRVVSPIMFGIRGDTGLGNNADELKDSYLLYFETVVRPYQEIILDGIQSVLYKNNIEFESEWIQYQPFPKEVAQEQASETKRTPTLNLSEAECFVRPEPEGFKLINSQPYTGVEPKVNGSTVKLYKVRQVNKKNRNLALKIAEESGNYYDYNYVKDNPNTSQMYWEEFTFVKSKS